MPTWKVRDKRAFLIAAMQELAGGAHISFEGNLSAIALTGLAGASDDETAALKRNTLSPPQDFVILPLEAELVETIGAVIGGTVPRGILHIQIEKDGHLELGIYDNFDPKASFFGSRLTSNFFDRLTSDGILKEWVSR